jgi:hypothetical protein
MACALHLIHCCFLMLGFEILSFLMGRLQKEEALKVRVTKASEVSEREKVMCFHGNPFFLSCTSELLVDKKRTPFCCGICRNVKFFLDR